MRGHKDKQLDNKQLSAIREKLASFLLLDVISDKGDFHCHSWTDNCMCTVNSFMDVLSIHVIIVYVYC